MSKEEFEDHKNIGGKIVQNSNIFVWTRTFSGVGSDSSNNNRYAWYVDNASGDLDDDCGNVSCVNYVAPAFYLKKSAIDHITDDGEIILKPAEQKENNEKENLQRLVQMASYPELLSVLTRLNELFRRRWMAVFSGLRLILCIRRSSKKMLWQKYMSLELRSLIYMSQGLALLWWL